MKKSSMRRSCHTPGRQSGAPQCSVYWPLRTASPPGSSSPSRCHFGLTVDTQVELRTGGTLSAVASVYFLVGLAPCVVAMILVPPMHSAMSRMMKLKWTLVLIGLVIVGPWGGGLF